MSSHKVFLCLLLCLASNATAGPPTAEKSKESSLLDGRQLPIKQGDDPLLKLLKLRANAASKEVYIRAKQWDSGQDVFLELYDSILNRLVPARLALCKTPQEKIELLSQALEAARVVETHARRIDELGQGNKANLPKAEFQRLTFEIQLQQARMEAAKKR